ncbi:MAG: phosphomannomutase/phosphoglucomutase, partial [Phycisphaerae bacterium]|nr:phosphomannomutase/phosphoglucomutase [Phycisphaerae bacterium]
IGDRYPITWAVCRARRVRLYPKCRGCKFNADELEAQARAEALEHGKDFDVIFKAYDIRGIVDENLDEEVAWKVGFAVGQYLLGCLDGAQREQPSAQKVILGYDMRPSSEPLSKACSEGVLASGADCTVIGQVETPALTFAVASLGACGGIMITASHNPVQYNGFKICGFGALPVGAGTGLEKIKEIAKGVTSTERPLRGKMLQVDISSRYLVHLKTFAGDIKPMKMVLDASNGMASKWTPSLLRQFNLDVDPLNYERSGRFAHDPNPMVVNNLAALQGRVRATGARLGVCFDGDADRAVFVDENAEPVRSDVVTALLAGEYLKKGRDVPIIYDLRSTWALKEEIERYGGTPRRERVGHTFFKAAMRKYDAPFGGELSGHYY